MSHQLGDGALAKAHVGKREGANGGWNAGSECGRHTELVQDQQTSRHHETGPKRFDFSEERRFRYLFRYLIIVLNV